eukprot:1161768-Pelagomonas_calceolata.AAC.2
MITNCAKKSNPSLSGFDAACPHNSGGLNAACPHNSGITREVHRVLQVPVTSLLPPAIVLTAQQKDSKVRKGGNE